VKRDNDQKPERSRCTTPRPIEARDLFRGQREVSIEFRGDIYRLRITRNDKLILTK
jgi:hemin uptake protein HemP